MLCPKGHIHLSALYTRQLSLSLRRSPEGIEHGKFRYFLSSVQVILLHALYGVLCFQLTNPSCDDCKNTVFFKARGHLLCQVLPLLVLSCLVLPVLDVSGFFVISNNHTPTYDNFSMNKTIYPFHTLYIFNIPQEHCANQLQLLFFYFIFYLSFIFKLQPLLLTIISMNGSGLLWAIRDKARLDKATSWISQIG